MTTAAYETILSVLERAQRERALRPYPSWHAFELERVLEAINLIRAPLGKLAISLDELRRVERQAYGHSDYTTKLALYASELALRP